MDADVTAHSGFCLQPFPVGQIQSNFIGGKERQGRVAGEWHLFGRIFLENGKSSLCSHTDHILLYSLSASSHFSSFTLLLLTPVTKGRTSLNHLCVSVLTT